MTPKPALNYKKDFDPDKGEKQTMEVSNTITKARSFKRNRGARDH